MYWNVPCHFSALCMITGRIGAKTSPVRVFFCLHITIQYRLSSLGASIMLLIHVGATLGWVWSWQIALEFVFALLGKCSLLSCFEFVASWCRWVQRPGFKSQWIGNSIWNWLELERDSVKKQEIQNLITMQF